VGSVRQESFAAIWRGAALERIRSIRVGDLTECRDCPWYSGCNRCAGLAEMETGSVLAPSPQACALARAFERIFRARRCQM
jgi:radical SAM protein with 4Fe4S-binding SPASM domain